MFHTTELSPTPGARAHTQYTRPASVHSTRRPILSTTPIGFGCHLTACGAHRISQTYTMGWLWANVCRYTISGAYLRYTNMYNSGQNTHTNSTPKRRHYTTTEDEMRWTEKSKKKNVNIKSHGMKWNTRASPVCVCSTLRVWVRGKLITERKDDIDFVPTPPPPATTISHTRFPHSGRSQKTSSAKKHVAFACTVDSFADCDRRCYRSHAISMISTHELLIFLC